MSGFTSHCYGEGMFTLGVRVRRMRVLAFVRAQKAGETNKDTNLV